MKEVTIRIKGLEMSRFDPQKFSCKAILIYEIGKDEKRQTLHLDLLQKSEALARGIMDFVKSQVIQEEDPDDILESFVIKKFFNEEKTEERLLIHFAKLCEKARFMKVNKNHKDYMKYYHEIMGSNISLK